MLFPFRARTLIASLTEIKGGNLLSIYWACELFGPEVWMPLKYVFSQRRRQPILADGLQLYSVRRPQLYSRPTCAREEAVGQRPQISLSAKRFHLSSRKTWCSDEIFLHSSTFCTHCRDFNFLSTLTGFNWDSLLHFWKIPLIKCSYHLASFASPPASGSGSSNAIWKISHLQYFHQIQKCNQLKSF